MTTKPRISTADIVLTGLFGTLTFVGTTLRIPMPSAVGAPFIHLGNAVLLLAVLLIGYRKGAFAGGIGFAIFDILNGYAAEAPYFILESFIVGGIATLIFMAFGKKDDKLYKIIIVAIGAGLTKIAMTFLKGIVKSLFLGLAFKPAVLASVASLPATLVNFVSTIVIVSLVYYPLKKIVDSFYRRAAQKF